MPAVCGGLSTQLRQQWCERALQCAEVLHLQLGSRLPVSASAVATVAARPHVRYGGGVCLHRLGEPNGCLGSSPQHHKLRACRTHPHLNVRHGSSRLVVVACSRHWMDVGS